MKLSKKFIKIFDKKGFRWVICIFFKLISFYKTGIINRFKYDRSNNRWMQFHRELCFYIDKRPNWNACIAYFEQYVNQINFVQYKPSDGDVIVDIGAGVGTETIIFSMKVGSGKVYAIEAHPDTYHSLCLLKDVNGFDNLVISNVAISDQNSMLYIENRDNHAENKIWPDHLNGIAIKAMTLDEYVEMNNILKINFLKMNIEGAEMDAIKGMNESIKIIDYIAISCHDFLISKFESKIKDTITEYLINNNYKVVSKNTGHVVKDSWIYGERLKQSQYGISQTY